MKKKVSERVQNNYTKKRKKSLAKDKKVILLILVRTNLVLWMEKKNKSIY